MRASLFLPSFLARLQTFESCTRVADLAYAEWRQDKAARLAWRAREKRNRSSAILGGSCSMHGVACSAMCAAATEENSTYQAQHSEVLPNSMAEFSDCAGQKALDMEG